MALSSQSLEAAYFDFFPVTLHSLPFIVRKQLKDNILAKSHLPSY